MPSNSPKIRFCIIYLTLYKSLHSFTFPFKGSCLFPHSLTLVVVSRVLWPVEVDPETRLWRTRATGNNVVLRVQSSLFES